MTGASPVASTAPLPGGEISLTYGGQQFRLLLDWAAIAWFERHSGASLVEVYVGIETGTPKLSLLAYLLLAMLQRHHPETDLDTAGLMSMSPAVFAQLQLTATEAMPSADGSAVGNGAAGSAPLNS